MQSKHQLVNTSLDFQTLEVTKQARGEVKAEAVTLLFVEQSPGNQILTSFCPKFDAHELIPRSVPWRWRAKPWGPDRAAGVFLE